MGSRFSRELSAADVSRLLEAGADIHARNENGWMPLHLAVSQSETLSVVSVLLEAGADVHARNENGWTPLHHAGGHSETPAVVNACWKRVRT